VIILNPTAKPAEDSQIIPSRERWDQNIAYATVRVAEERKWSCVDAAQGIDRRDEGVRTWHDRANHHFATITR
jgi:hypothetical protein